MKREWECWDCGHIFEQENKPHFCPHCRNIHLLNKDAFFIELPRSRKPLFDEEFRHFAGNSINLDNNAA